MRLRVILASDGGGDYVRLGWGSVCGMVINGVIGSILECGLRRGRVVLRSEIRRRRVILSSICGVIVASSVTRRRSSPRIFLSVLLRLSNSPHPTIHPIPMIRIHRFRIRTQSQSPNALILILRSCIIKIIPKRGNTHPLLKLPERFIVKICCPCGRR